MIGISCSEQDKPASIPDEVIAAMNFAEKTGKPVVLTFLGETKAYLPNFWLTKYTKDQITEIKSSLVDLEIRIKKADKEIAAGRIANERPTACSPCDCGGGENLCIVNLACRCYFVAYAGCIGYYGSC